MRLFFLPHPELPFPLLHIAALVLNLCHERVRTRRHAEFLNLRNQAGVLVVKLKKLPLAVDVAIIFSDAAQIV